MKEERKKAGRKEGFTVRFDKNQHIEAIDYNASFDQKSFF